MTTADREAVEAPACPRCQGPLVPGAVRTVLWRNDQPAIIEDVPARTCATCLEQFYDDRVSDALRRLAETTFDVAAADRVIAVPVFSLASRLRADAPLAEDCYVD